MKNIENWSVTKYPNGTYQLSITTKDKGVPYHRLNDNTFWIGDFYDDDFSADEIDAITLEIPDFLPMDKRYICTNMCEKSWIYFFWIPFGKEELMGSEEILSSRKNQ
jgi:hypothetical protein